MGGLMILKMMALLLLTATPAFAQDEEATTVDEEDPSGQAKQLFKNGVRLYEEGLYEEAVLAFNEAYSISDRHALLYNIANAYERLGQFQEALDALNRYRVFATEDEAETLSRRITNLERRRDEAEQAARAQEALVEQQRLAAVEAANQAAVEQNAAQQQQSTATLRRGGVAPGVKWGLVGGGAVIGVAGGGVAVYTFIEGQGHIETGSEEAYENLRPVNAVGLMTAGIGAAVAVVGLVLPLRQKSLSIGATANGMRIDGTF